MEGRTFNATEGILEMAPVAVKESKAGYKTTEFWAMIATAVAVNLNGVPLPQKYEGAVTAALAIAYAFSRGWAKRGTPHIDPDPAAVKSDAVS